MAWVIRRQLQCSQWNASARQRRGATRKEAEEGVQGQEARENSREAGKRQRPHSGGAGRLRTREGRLLRRGEERWRPGQHENCWS
eukprot:2685308-Pleurochrysis_carterae.AAC.1